MGQFLSLENLSICEILSRWPETVTVFFRHRMACVGCVMAPFETPGEVARIYGLSRTNFLQELHETILSKGKQS